MLKILNPAICIKTSFVAIALASSCSSFAAELSCKDVFVKPALKQTSLVAVAAALGGNRIVVVKDQEVTIYEGPHQINKFKIKWDFRDVKIFPIDKDHFILKGTNGVNNGAVTEQSFLLPVSIDSLNVSHIPDNMHHLSQASDVVGVELSSDKKFLNINYRNRSATLNVSTIIGNTDILQSISSTKKIQISTSALSSPFAIDLNHLVLKPNQTKKYELKGQRVSSLTAIPNSRMMLVAKSWEPVRIIDIDTSATKAQIKTKFETTSVATSKDGKRFILGTGAGCNSEGFNKANGVPSGEILFGDSELGIVTEAIAQDSTVNTVRFTPDEKYLVIGRLDHQLILYEIASKKEVYKIDLKDIISDLRISPEGKYVVASTYYGGVKVVDLNSGKKIYEVPYDNWVTSVAMSPDGKLFATGDHKNFTRIVETKTGKILHEIRHDDWVQAMEITPDGKYLIAGDKSGVIKVIELSTGAVPFEKSLGSLSNIESIEVLPDGKSFVVGTYNGNIHIFDLYEANSALSVKYKTQPKANIEVPKGRKIDVLAAPKMKTKEELAYDAAVLELNEAENKLSEIKMGEKNYAIREARLNLAKQKVERLGRDLEPPKNIDKPSMQPLSFAQPKVLKERNDAVTSEYPNGTPIIAFARLDPGTFEMGDTKKVSITFTQPLEVMSVPTTQKVWASVIEMSGIDLKKYPSVVAGENHPVEAINMDDIKQWFLALNVLSKNPELKFQNKLEELFPGHKYGAIYRLPTEYEWEYAARLMGAAKGDYSHGDTVGDLGDYAWFDENSNNEIHSVGLKKPAFIKGVPIYDLHGNVMEFTSTYFDQYKELEDGVDPKGPAPRSPDQFVGRGGSYNFKTIDLRIGHRSSLWSRSDIRYRGTGFRIFRSMP